MEVTLKCPKSPELCLNVNPAVGGPLSLRHKGFNIITKKTVLPKVLQNGKGEKIMFEEIKTIVADNLGLDEDSITM